MKYKTIEIFSDTTVGDDLFLSKILFENDNVILGEFENNYYKDSKKLTCMICKKNNIVFNQELDFYYARFIYNKYDILSLYVKENKDKYNLVDDIDIDKFKTNIKHKAKSLNFDLDLFDIIIENNKILLYYNDDLEFDRI